ncbi:hypothetical protein [Nocardioides ochotonae]|uniref:hypothetical protein n=1 Tax=Nocardioides ochotonae TaxID=2685869 RepID=UPI00140C0BE1|nr:hypothetical protein [Nocardioides ochotonae]
MSTTSQWEYETDVLIAGSAAGAQTVTHAVTQTESQTATRPVTQAHTHQETR